MGRKSKGLRLPNLVELQSHQIPPWMQAARTPHGETLLDLLNEALGQPGLVSGGLFVPFFERIAALGEAQASGLDRAGRIKVAVEALHVIPAFVEIIERPSCRWLREALGDLFRWRLYEALKHLPRTRGRPRVEQLHSAIVDHVASAALPEAIPGRDPKRVQERNHQAALHAVAPVLGISRATLANEVSSAKRERVRRDARVEATWKRIEQARKKPKRRRAPTKTR